MMMMMIADQMQLTNSCLTVVNICPYNVQYKFGTFTLDESDTFGTLRRGVGFSLLYQIITTLLCNGPMVHHCRQYMPIIG